MDSNADWLAKMRRAFCESFDLEASADFDKSSLLHRSRLLVGNNSSSGDSSTEQRIGFSPSERTPLLSSMKLEKEK